GLAIDQIAQSGLSSLSVIYYSAHLFSKHFSRWLTKLIDLGMVVKEGENLSIRSLREVAE
ncbi:hypothetical protein RZO85_22365, partial [Raoultella ornithinolytica]|uniref:hypothetical protein n=1 Tax=Raoultella ornithinolytica TaxID=54291 RepID=UPI00292BD9EE